MKTMILCEKDLLKAAELLRLGQVVAIPTETVYGLAANAFDYSAVKSIFKIKNRTAQNPLTIHVCSLEQVFDLVKDFTNIARKLANEFWPGPLTMVLPKSNLVPSIVTAGSDFVAIRFPSNNLAKMLIKTIGFPVVASSANISGKPSSTKVPHVLNDFDGKIAAVLDGGECCFGLESTIVFLDSNNQKILRQGVIKKEDIEKIIGKTVSNLYQNVKCKHYSTNAKLIIIPSNKSLYVDYVNSYADVSSSGALCYDEDLEDLKIFSVSYGGERDFVSQSRKIFSALRELDLHSNIKTIYARCDRESSSGAVFDRIHEACDKIQRL
ncbi:MAG: threonylcarbamoyl-AMP synthase [Oscillospiraceae bacterium]|jgi:L-threonylcarbamoyladenylate synthase|nr:threonylcarbamoyl-AMP synthase [Oscillospiraceae bacterium]